MSGPISPTTPGGTQPSAPKGQVVQIVSLPEGLQNNARAIRVEGEVVAQNKDGSVRVHTDQGDIDIQVRGRQPQPGAKVEVDIPAGSPPRTATIRPAPVPAPSLPLPQTPTPTVPLPQTPVTSQPAPTPQTGGTNAQEQAPQAPQSPSPDTIVTTTKPQTPLPPTYQPHAAGATPAQQPAGLPPLSAGETVQLMPVPFMDTPDMPLMTQPTATIADKVTAQAQNTAQKAQGNLITNLLQAVKSVLPTNTPPMPTAQAPATPVLPGTTMKPALPGGIIPSSAPVQNGQPIFPVQAQQAPVLLAKIVSVASPADQRIFFPQNTVSAPPVPSITPTIPSGVPVQQSTPVPVTSQVVPQPMMMTVVDFTPQHLPIIQIPVNNAGTLQNFVVQATTPTPLPAGTQITLLPQLQATPVIPTPETGIMPTQAAPVATPAAMPAQISSLPPAWRALLPLMQPSTLWPAVDDLFQNFYQATPQAAQILGRIIPSPTNAQNFGPAVLLFAAALKSGDIQGWLGEKKLDMIQKLGKGDLLSRLSGETSSLSQNADTPATDWKTYPIPLLYQNEISKVLFHVRREPDEEKKQNQGGGTRFVMDVALTRMGSVQLDGLVRGNRVDLIVRTQYPLTLSMQDAMRTAYAKALDNTDIFGDIGFQSDVLNFIQVLKGQDALASA